MNNEERFALRVWAACEVPFLVVFGFHLVIAVSSFAAAFTDSEYWVQHLVLAAFFLVLSYAAWLGLKASCSAREELNRDDH